MLYVALIESTLWIAESSVMIWSPYYRGVLMAVLLAGTKPTETAGCCSCLESSFRAARVTSQRSFSILTADIGSSNILDLTIQQRVVQSKQASRVQDHLVSCIYWSRPQAVFFFTSLVALYCCFGLPWPHEKGRDKAHPNLLEPERAWICLDQSNAVL